MALPPFRCTNKLEYLRSKKRMPRAGQTYTRYKYIQNNNDNTHNQKLINTHYECKIRIHFTIGIK